MDCSERQARCLADERVWRAEKSFLLSSAFVRRVSAAQFRVRAVIAVGRILSLSRAPKLRCHHRSHQTDDVTCAFRRLAYPWSVFPRIFGSSDDGFATVDLLINSRSAWCALFVLVLVTFHHHHHNPWSFLLSSLSVMSF